MRWQIAGLRTKAKFRESSVPQAVAAEGSFEKIYDSLPRLQNPEPDLIYGLSTDLLPNKYCGKYPVTYLEPALKHFDTLHRPEWGLTP